FGRSDSPNALKQEFAFAVPSGLLRADEEIVLTAQIEDVDHAIGRHEIRFTAARDDINPEVAVVRPAVGYGPTEFSDFELAVRAYDNVKVAKLEIYTAYGVKEANTKYHQPTYTSPLRTIHSIPDVDADPITTNNIDTPVYSQPV